MKKYEPTTHDFFNAITQYYETESQQNLSIIHYQLLKLICSYTKDQYCILEKMQCQLKANKAYIAQSTEMHDHIKENFSAKLIDNMSHHKISYYELETINNESIIGSRKSILIHDDDVSQYYYYPEDIFDLNLLTNQLG